MNFVCEMRKSIVWYLYNISILSIEEGTDKPLYPTVYGVNALTPATASVLVNGRSEHFVTEPK